MTKVDSGTVLAIPTSPSEQSARWSLLIAELAGGFLVTLGLVVLTGWYFDVPVLKSIHPSFVSMKANTALGFVLCGSALWLLRRERITEAVACAVGPPVVGPAVGQAASATPVRRRSGRSKGARILLAEDHPISQEVATAMLRQVGYHCDAATNGRQALEAVMGQPYDLVLTDCQMPEMDGFAATHVIRQTKQEGPIRRRSAGRLPIIALTANAISGDRERCLEAGMDDYLSKPLNADRSITIIGSRLQRTTASHTPAGGSPAIEQPPQDLSDAPTVTRREARPPFDCEMLLTQWGGHRDFVFKLIPKFQTQAQSELQQIEQSIAAGDAELTRQLAHRLKGSASYLCAPGIRELAAQLEAMGREGDLSNAGTVLAELRVELQRCLDFSPESATATPEKQPGVGVYDANSDR